MQSNSEGKILFLHLIIFHNSEKKVRIDKVRNCVRKKATVTLVSVYSVVKTGFHTTEVWVSIFSYIMHAYMYNIFMQH